jgi:signal transduction protein with GAF and PtsI domain
LRFANAQLEDSQAQVAEMLRTVSFLKEVFQVLAQEHDREDFQRTMVSWFCECFGVDRCSLMKIEDSQETMSISAQHGIAPEIAGGVRVRVGQGIAGWVAHHRKPLFVRMKDDPGATYTHQDAYNSDSFICVPLVHSNRLVGVLNLSNKRGGAPFNELDLDRAVLAGSVLAMTLSQRLPAPANRLAA